MTCNLEITKITLLTGWGTDKLVLHTDLPDGCWPYEDKASVKMEVAKGHGQGYARQHFPGILVEVIETK